MKLPEAKVENLMKLNSIAANAWFMDRFIDELARQIVMESFPTPEQADAIEGYRQVGPC